MTRKEVSIYLKVHPTTIFEMVKAGELPAYQVGNRWRFDKDKIDAWKAAQQDWTKGKQGEI